MSPHAKTLLDEGKIYVSWGLMVFISFLLWNTAITLTEIRAELKLLSPLVNEFAELKQNFALMNKEVAGQGKDIAELKKKLDPYEVNFQK